MINIIISIFIGTVLSIIIISILFLLKSDEEQKEIKKIEFQIEALRRDLERNNQNLKIQLKNISKYKAFWDQARLIDKHNFEEYDWPEKLKGEKK